MSKKRIFISFAIEDKTLRDLLVGQSKNKSSPFEFVDMSVKQPWDTAWKTKCRTKIKGCEGVLAIVTKNTQDADGQIWEMKCAKEEQIPSKGIFFGSSAVDERLKTFPIEFKDVKIMNWTWDNIANWIESL